MPEPSAWDDERYGGTLFPNARPAPERYIARDDFRLTTVRDEEARVQARRAQRAAGDAAPEPDPDAAWRMARAQAMQAVREDRRRERAGLPLLPLTDEPTRAGDPLMTLDLSGAMSAFTQVLTAAASSLAALCDTPAFRALAGTVADPTNSPMVRVAAEAEHERARAAMLGLTTSATSATSADEIREAVRNFAALGVRMHTARTSLGRSRERYLPGTRHDRPMKHQARRGGHHA